MFTREISCGLWCRLIDTEPEFYALVFSRTRVGADRLAEKLNSAGLDVEALHGEVSQAQRERILAKFKEVMPVFLLQRMWQPGVLTSITFRT
ncbi:MAG: helicase-related protein [Saprospiraceae bacterium]